MRVLLITDSLGLPRPEVPLEDTWTHMLSRDLWNTGSEAVIIGQRGLTMKSARDRLLSEIVDYAPDVVVLQLGIVDCCRRPYSNNIRRIVERSTTVRRLVSRNRYRLTQYIGRPAVPPDIFARSLADISDVCRQHGKILAAIEIAPAGKALASQIYRVQADINNYNSIILSQVGEGGISAIFPFKALPGDSVTIPDDGHHLTKIGHQAVYKAVHEFLRSHANARVKSGQPGKC